MPLRLPRTESTVGLHTPPKTRLASAEIWTKVCIHGTLLGLPFVSAEDVVALSD
ncbi:unnamed protein product [marine sediment metagenome]|uniref:Uncharacterized protein n=1 Tax=marine sediment metagenome TaxID=412755 RepID=X1ECV2_9ZZZZ